MVEILAALLGAFLAIAYIYISGKLVGRFLTFLWYGTCKPDKSLRD